MKSVIKFFSVFILFITILITAIFFYFYSFGGVSGWLETKLSSPKEGFFVRINNFKFSLKDNFFPLILNSKEVEVTYKTEKFNLSNIEFVIGHDFFITGMPTKIILQTDEINIYKNETFLEFSQNFPLAHSQTPNVKIFKGNNFPKFDILKNYIDLWPIGIQETKINVSKINFFEKSYPNIDPIVFENIKIEVGPKNGNKLTGYFNTKVQANFNNHSKIEFFTEIDTNTLISEFKIKLRNFNSTDTPLFLQKTNIFSRIYLENSNVEAFGILDEKKIKFVKANITSERGDIIFNNKNKKSLEFYEVKLNFEYNELNKNILIKDLNFSNNEDEKISLSGKISNVNTSYPSFSINAIFDNTSLNNLINYWPSDYMSVERKKILNDLSGGKFLSLELNVSGETNQKYDDYNISNLEAYGNFSNIRISTSKLQYKKFVGTLDGNFSVDYLKDKQSLNVQGEVKLKDGYTIVKHSKKKIMIPSAKLVFNSYNSSLNISNLNVDFAEYGNLAILSNSAFNQDKSVIDFIVNSDQLDVELLKLIWPELYLQKTKKWITKHFKGGIIKNAKINIKSKNKNQINDGFDINGKFKLINSNFVFSKNKIVSKVKESNINFSNKLVNVKIKQGNIDNLLINDSKINYEISEGNNIYKNNLILDLLINGQLSKAIQILSSLNLKNVNFLNFLNGSEGKTNFSLKTNLYYQKNKQFIDKNTVITGVIDNVISNNLPLGVKLNKGNLKFKYTKDEIFTSGFGNFYNIPTKFTYTQKKNEDIELFLKISSNPNLINFFNQFYDFPISGKINGVYNIIGNLKSKNFQINTVSQLEGADIKLKFLNWTKIRGEKSTLKAIINFEKGKISKIFGIDFKAKDFSAFGRLSFDEGKLESGFFEDINFSGNEIKKIMFDKKEKNYYKVTAEGKSLDLVSIRKNDGISSGKEIDFDITAEKIIIDSKISFSGNLIGKTKKNGNGKADLKGSLLVSNKPIMTEASIKALFGKSGEYLDGIGLIGGGEAKLSYRPISKNKNFLTIVSNSAGKVLTGLNITDTIRNGNLRLETEFSGKSFSKYETTINIEKFNVIEAPKAVRAFSVLSLAGLYSLVEGDGTKFEFGEAKITTNNEYHELNRIKATGNALGVSLLGNYNKKTKEVDISGNLIPVNQFSKILGVVPVLGEVLTGLDKTGVFATQFSIKGNYEDPKVSVNASSLAPGLLRDLFSPDWLIKERERIFGANQ